MFTVKEVIKQEAIALPLNENMTIVCPKCIQDHEHQGNPAHWEPNKSCSITRERNGLVYKCHRASCGLKGFESSLIMTPNYKDKRKFKPKNYIYPTNTLSNTQVSYLMTKYDLLKPEIFKNQFRFCPTNNSVVMPIFDYRSYEVGCVDRVFWTKREPKAISYWFNDVPKLYFPKGYDTHRNNFEQPLVIVEDIISAIKVNRILPCVALLGSNISDNIIHHIGKLFTRVVVSLDADAIKSSLRAAKRYGPLFEMFEVCYTKQDPKDMPPTTLYSTYNQYKRH